MEMTDEDFVAAAVEELSSEVVAAAAACAAAQLASSQRMSPGQVVAMADMFDAPRGPVLALLGWLHGEGSRANRWLFVDILTGRRGGTPRLPRDRETQLALAVCRTLQ